MRMKKTIFLLAGVLFCWGQVLAKYELTVTEPTTLVEPCNGFMTATATGNAGPYAFEWFKEDGTPVTANLVVSDDNSSTLKYCTGVYKVIVSNYYGCETVLSETMDLELTAFLEGAYDTSTGEMKTTLNVDRKILPGQIPENDAISKIPTGQPYYAAPWNYNGKEGLNWTNYQVNENYLDVVDWVLVSLRTGLKKSTEIESKSGLLKKDGTIFFPQKFCKHPNGTEFYVVLEHRNHLAISSPFTKVNNNSIKYDFTSGDSYTGADENGEGATGAGQKVLINGKWAMQSGDGNQANSRSDINGSDLGTWQKQNGNFDRYNSTCDFNFDGDVNGSDKFIWQKANGIFGAVDFKQ